MYGAPQFARRQTLWDGLCDIGTNLSGEWGVRYGDFLQLSSIWKYVRYGLPGINDDFKEWKNECQVGSLPHQPKLEVTFSRGGGSSSVLGEIKSQTAPFQTKCQC